jgi:hypothetical protein
MRKQFAELNSPPKIFTDMLDDPIMAQLYKEKSLTFNNVFGFAFNKCSYAPDSQKGSWRNFVKINGKLDYNIWALKVPAGKQPAFAQIYTVGNDEADQLRREYFMKATGRKPSALFSVVEERVFTVLKEVMRTNPFSKTLMTAGQLQEDYDVSEIKVSNNLLLQLILILQVKMYSSRQLQDMQQAEPKVKINITGGDPSGRIEAADPVTVEQVALVWVDDAGLPPQIPDQAITYRGIVFFLNSF